MRYHVDRLAQTRPAVEALFSSRVGSQPGGPVTAPAGVLAVFDRSGIVYGQGLGRLADGRSPTLDTAFRIASCTKSFTAAALLLCVERGLVDLDDQVDRHLRLGPLIGPDQEPVVAPTLRQLASMTGGLPTDDAWADRQESLSDNAFSDLLDRGARMIAEPGQRYEYSNLGFAMLGAVIARVSGRSYLEVVTEELIKPLQLTGIGYHTGVGGVDGVAAGYRDTGDQWEELPFSGPGAFSSIGGVFASARGLAGWIAWLQGAFVPGDDRDQPLGRLSRQLMQTQQTVIATGTTHATGTTDSSGYGLGLVVDEDPRHGTIVAHSGGYPGYGAHMRWHPGSGLGVLAFENARYSQPIFPVTAALSLILDELIRPDREPLLWPETAAARDGVERLLRGWDDAVAAELFADNVDLDEPLIRRQRRIEKLAAEVELIGPALPLVDASPVSRSPAQLAWTVPGRAGSLRCEISLTAEEPPRVQSLQVRRG